MNADDDTDKIWGNLLFWILQWKCICLIITTIKSKHFCY